MPNSPTGRIEASIFSFATPWPAAICRLNSSTWPVKTLSGPFPSRLGRLEQPLCSYIEDFDVRDECVAGSVISAGDEGLHPFLSADLETKVAVDELGAALSDLLQNVPQAFSAYDIEALSLLQAGDQKVGYDLSIIIQRLIAGLVLEADDGDGILHVDERRRRSFEGESARRAAPPATRTSKASAGTRNRRMPVGFSRVIWIVGRALRTTRSEMGKPSSIRTRSASSSSAV